MNWIETEFYIPETRHDPVLHGRIGLQDYQRDALREALRKDENGNFLYSIIVWSDIKKSAKSTIAASVVLARAEQTEWGEFYIVANDLKIAGKGRDLRIPHPMVSHTSMNENDRKAPAIDLIVQISTGDFDELLL